MSTLVVASNEQDAQAAQAVLDHHAELSATLARHIERVVNTAIGGEREPAEKATAILVDWCDNELIPHALTEEATIYPAAQEDPTAKLLVDAMLMEHQEILALVESLRTVTSPVVAAATAKALGTLFISHLSKENEQILPLLSASMNVSLAKLLDGMHELLGQAEVGCGGECTCGHEDSAETYPELDARLVPHAIRHATIFGALDSVQAGAGMVLVAPHDPLPLLQQIEARTPARFEIEYLERGPEAWRLQFVRR